MASTDDFGKILRTMTNAMSKGVSASISDEQLRAAATKPTTRCVTLSLP